MKRKLKDGSLDGLLTSHVDQTLTYQTTNLKFGVMLVLYLSKHHVRTAHMDTRRQPYAGRNRERRSDRQAAGAARNTQRRYHRGKEVHQKAAGTQSSLVLGKAFSPRQASILKWMPQTLMPSIAKKEAARALLATSSRSALSSGNRPSDAGSCH